MGQFKQLLSVAAINLRANSLPHLALAALMTGLAPVLIGISGLNAQAAAQPLEMYASLIGIVLLTPIFMPEQDERIADAVAAKAFPHLATCLLRACYSLAVLALLLGMLTYYMKWQGSEVGYTHAAGGFASAVMLGAIGMIGAAIARNAVVGYMAAAAYYGLNFGGSAAVGKLYLFGMSHGDGLDGKYGLLGCSLALMALAFLSMATARKLTGK